MDAQLAELERWIYGVGQLRRFTQDSPVMPDVWLAYNAALDKPLDLLLEPHELSDSAQLARAILSDDETPDDQPEMELAYNQSHVAVRLTFAQMLRGVLPLSVWWQRHLWPAGSESVAAVLETHRDEIIAHMSSEMRDQGRRPVSAREIPGTLVWFVGLVGRVLLGADAEAAAPDGGAPQPRYGELVDAVGGMLGDVPLRERPGGPLLWAINLNRPARHALWRSRNTVKADAATLLFELSCRNLCWAVVDSGIDAGHPAFARRDADGKPVLGSTRVKATYDFTGLRSLLSGKDAEHSPIPSAARREITKRLQDGRPVDWGMLAEHLEIKAGDGYRAPEHEHGTHVAGILGADWRMTDDDAALSNDVKGICPDISLYDLRVFDKDGHGDEFAIIAALQFIRWINANAPVPVVHGVNLSLSLEHNVGAFACGRTPICVECERLLGSGTIVVAAAGNEGRAIYTMGFGKTEGYRQMTITDPGNATGVITVGATHRHQPHTYGVSYFSSRGPTGDGRVKPDLVAPGEKVTAPVPGGGLKSLDGTSQAAPHVSGVAALVLARHPELIGRPDEIKRVLMATATDLGRERYFQGCGVVDALRAIQSI